MRKMLMITAMVMACLFTTFISCKKDKGQPADQVQKNYFTVQSGTFVEGTFPTASSGNAPTITSVTGNSSILEGGSNPITIITSSTVKEVLIGVKGKSGYYKVNSSDLKSTMQTYLVYLLFSSDFIENNFTVLTAIVDNSGLISASQTISVTKITAGTGKLQINCSWDKLNDLDLHLVEPSLNEIYWDSTVSLTGGMLDVDSNPVCILDYINSENITYSGNAVVGKGKYIVKISLFESCDVTDITHYVVTARMDGVLITPSSGTNPYYGTVTAAEAEIGGTGPDNGVPVMEFNVATTKSDSVGGNQKMLQFSYPWKPNLLKRSMVTR